MIEDYGKIMVEKQLLEIIKCVLNNEKCQIQIDEKDWNSIITFAKRHQVENMLFYGALLLPDQLKTNDKIIAYLKKTLMRATARNDIQLHAVEEMQEHFEECGIYNIALKGVNTKRRYPEDCMRTMGDLDILCKSSQQSKVKKAMLELGYNDYQEGRKHDHYSRLPFVSVEMHRDLVATDSDYSKYYKDIWNRCNPKDGCVYTFEMSLVDEFVYNIIHMTEHFKEGGIGIRFIMDIYVYNHLKDLNFEYLRCELDKLGLINFYDRISLLAEKWFGKNDVLVDEITLKLEDFILKCGVYGSQKNADALAVSKSGRVSFLLKACFPNLENMQSLYPWLEKYPFLLPYSWILRGIRSLTGRKDNVKTQLRKFNEGDRDYGNQLRKFYEECGL
jgi:hypothetical protein